MAAALGLPCEKVRGFNLLLICSIVVALLRNGDADGGALDGKHGIGAVLYLGPDVVVRDLEADPPAGRDGALRDAHGGDLFNSNESMPSMKIGRIKMSKKAENWDTSWQKRAADWLRDGTDALDRAMIS